MYIEKLIEELEKYAPSAEISVLDHATNTTYEIKTALWVDMDDKNVMLIIDTNEGILEDEGPRRGAL